MDGIEVSTERVEASLSRVRSLAADGEFGAVFGAFGELRTAVDAAELAFMDSLRESMTWAEIGELTGITKEGAFLRYRRRLRSTG